MPTSTPSHFVKFAQFSDTYPNLKNLKAEELSSQMQSPQVKRNKNIFFFFYKFIYK